jgi:hypothetical protein
VPVAVPDGVCVCDAVADGVPEQDADVVADTVGVGGGLFGSGCVVTPTVAPRGGRQTPS